MKKRVLFCICLILITVFPMSSCEFLANIPFDFEFGIGEPTAKQIYESTAPSVVTINAQSNGVENTGTAFFINNGSTIVTNFHVIKNCTTAFITLANGEEYSVESVLGYSEEKDIAILKVSYTNGVPLEIRETDVVTGEKVYAIGNSLGFLSGSLSEGIISTAQREFDGKTYIQTTASVTNGNSGGPLIDSYGKVIGIVSAGFGEGLDLNFAVPVSQIATIDVSIPKKLEEIAHIYQPPHFSWVENDKGFQVTARFICSCGETKTASTFVSNTDYSVWQNSNKTLTTFEFTATVMLDGKPYTDTRYIKYEYQSIRLNTSNCEDYLSISCQPAGWRTIRASVHATNDSVYYSNVSVKLHITASGRTVYEGYGGGVYPYYSTHTVTVGVNQEREIELDSQVYSLTAKYTFEVSGEVSKSVMTAYLSTN